MRYEVTIIVHDERTAEAVGEALLAVLPDNAALAIRDVPDSSDDAHAVDEVHLWMRGGKPM